MVLYSSLVFGSLADKIVCLVIVDSGDDISADRLKNAAATKKLAIFDAFEILSRIEQEEKMLEDNTKQANKFGGFAESRSK